MRYSKYIVSFCFAFILVFCMTAGVFAQESVQPAETNSLTMFTTYPSQEIGIGESVSIPLKLEVTTQPQTVQLSMKEI